MRFTDRNRDPEKVEEQRRKQIENGEDEDPPSTAGLRDRLAHFTWCVGVPMINSIGKVH